MSYSKFLKEKAGKLSFGTIVRTQVEAFLLWLIQNLPGVAGMVLRYPIYKLLFKRLDGLPWIQPMVTIVHTERLEVGKHFGVNSGTYINAIGTIKIGDYVLIGSNVTISSGKHPIEGKMPPVFARATEPLPIVIEDDVWIAAGAVILPGITLAKGTVVGANSVVTKNTQPYSVVAGIPAQHMRFRE